MSEPVQPKMIYYFGAWPGETGHYLRLPSGTYTSSRRGTRVSPWSLGELDAHLLDPNLNDWANRAEQIEGHGKLFHKDGWTCFTFWCRRFDTRGNSNSAFLINRELLFTELLEEAQVALPKIWKGLAGVRLVNEHSNQSFQVPGEAP